MRQGHSDLAGYAHGQVPREVRETQILSLAEELFAQRGYAGLTMNELADRAGVTKPVIYSVVRSKDELYRRCLQRAGDELAAAVGAAAGRHGRDLEGAVRAGNLAFFRFIASHARAFGMLFADDAGAPHAVHVERIRARQAALLEQMLTRQAAAAAHAVDGQRIELAVRAINGAAEALAHWWRSHPEVPAEDLAERLTELLLPGLRAVILGES
jgi:AcrR family transcriptional regulator